jgi:hypothetical protein
VALWSSYKGVSTIYFFLITLFLQDVKCLGLETKVKQIRTSQVLEKDLIVKGLPYNLGLLYHD